MKTPKQKQDLIYAIICFALLGTVMTVNTYLYFIKF